MVLKKTNSVFNSGATQRVEHGRTVCEYSHQANLITLHVTPSRDNADLADSSKGRNQERSSSPSRFHQIREVLDFLADHLGWSELRDVDCRDISDGHFPHSDYFKRHYDNVIYFPMNKGKRWALLDILPKIVTMFNLLANSGDLHKTGDVTQKIQTELWDKIVSQKFWTKRKGDYAIRDLAESLPVYGSCTPTGSVSQNNWKHLVKFGLMDLFQKTDFSVSVEQHPVIGWPKNKNFTTSRVCNRQKNGKEPSDKHISKFSKKKKVEHSRGIQRPSSWKLSSPSKMQRRQNEKRQEIDIDTFRMKYRKSSSRSLTSSEEAHTAQNRPKDRVHVTLTKSPNVDARALNVNFVIKKYGLLPYNAPRVAICKTKSRPSGRLGIHKGFTYARLQQEIALAKEEISENYYQTVNSTSHAADNVYYCDNEINERLFYESVKCKADNNTLTNDVGAITLNDFIVQGKPMCSKKKGRKSKRRDDIQTNFENIEQDFSFIQLTTLDTLHDSDFEMFPCSLSSDEESDWIMVKDNPEF